MKYLVVFLVVCVALAAAAPQLLTNVYGTGYYGAGYLGAVPNTLVAGPTVVNNPGLGYGARIIAPGYVGPAIF